MTRQIIPSIQERLDRFQVQIAEAVNIYISSRDIPLEEPEVILPFEDILNHNLPLQGLMECVLRIEQLPENIRQEVLSSTLDEQYGNHDEIYNLAHQTDTYEDVMTCRARQTCCWDFQEGLSSSARSRNRNCARRALSRLSKMRITPENIADLIQRAEVIDETYMDIVVSDEIIRQNAIHIDRCYGNK